MEIMQAVGDEPAVNWYEGMKEHAGREYFYLRRFYPKYTSK